MANYKNIRIKMKSGKTRLQRVMVLASGKYKFVKNLTKSRSSPKKGKTSTKKSRSTKKGGRSMARGKSLFRSMGKLAKAGALITPLAVTLATPADTATKIQWVSRRYFGYDTKSNKLVLGDLVQGWGPFVVVSAGLKLVSKINGLIRSI